ncbi:hypothetical protein [Curtobacterium sp. VKM Ac-2922]|uniref:hypothetical protein n=1 Tax=Curtobacterium sp. VKM Ac-2922 TaxID=2929475 RepID=UPI001FB35233|nr:hypothetical protein [Curtobacterium sp. VKM Ac-2922]MCJ1715369.1 hypothetical protein [Curtobacterium sp. VKM Ac-2922]
MFTTTTHSLRRCTVTTAVLVAVGATTLGFGATAANADTAAPSTTVTVVPAPAHAAPPAADTAAAAATTTGTDTDRAAASTPTPTPTADATPTATPTTLPEPAATPVAVSTGAPAAPTATPAATEAATALVVVVRGQGTATTAPTWSIAADGTVTYSDSSEVQSGDPATPIRVRQDGSLELDALGFDQQGNVVPGLDDLTWSSSVGGDTFTPTTSTDAVTLRFAHASTHVITARSGSLTRTFSVEVDPLTAAAPTAGSTTRRTPTGQLAFTGADETGPLAWALGLLGAGGMLLLHRLRRRRA